MSYTTDYTYDLSQNSTSSGAPVVFWILYLVLIIVAIASLWKIFAKAGKPGWAALVPIYNFIVQLQIIGRPLWWILLFLIPFVNIIVAIIVTNDMAKSFGKSVGWTVGLLFLPFIFYPMLGFGSAKYMGPSAGK